MSNTVVTKLDPVVLELVEPTPGISPGGGGGGGGTLGAVEQTVGTPPVAVAPTPGISPARAVPEKTHASVIAKNTRLMDCLL